MGIVHSALRRDLERTRVALTTAPYPEGTQRQAIGELLAALGRLTEVLLPHLEREETEAMPMVAATLTRREWLAWEQQFAIKVKTFMELGDEGRWTLWATRTAG